MAKNSTKTNDKTETENTAENTAPVATKTKSDVDKVLEGLTSTSGKIRYLNSLGWSRGAIAKKLDKKYQHVRNVLVTPVAQPKEEVKG